jgi:hypothetical protein
MSISQTASDLTGKSQLAGAERQPGVERLRHALYLERAQQLVRMDNIAATISAMGVNNPTPAIPGNGAAITPRPPSSTELVSDDFPIIEPVIATLWRANGGQ